MSAVGLEVAIENIAHKTHRKTPQQQHLIDQLFENSHQKELCEGDLTVSTIRTLQQNNVWVLGLTSRTCGQAPRTIECLGNFGLNFTVNAPLVKSRVAHPNPELRTLYDSGIIFTSGNRKGNILLDFFTMLQGEFGYTPLHVVFCDDRHHNCADVVEHLPSIQCYHYQHPSIPTDIHCYDRVLDYSLKSKGFDLERVRSLWVLSQPDAILVAQVLWFIDSDGADVVEDTATELRLCELLTPKG